MIDVIDLSFTYPGEDTKVFDGFNMHLDKGQLVAVTGQSGCGKTTLMKLLLREYMPDSGRIMLADLDTATVKENELYTLRRRIGMVFQDVKLLEDRSVFENLAFCARALELPKKAEFDRVTAILKLMGMLDYHGRLPSQLSGGQRAKIGIGRALMSNPVVLLCDEPTGNLDPTASEEVIKLLKVIQSQGTSIILATHDLGLVEKYNIQRICLKHEGEN